VSRLGFAFSLLLTLAGATCAARAQEVPSGTEAPLPASEPSPPEEAREAPVTETAEEGAPLPADAAATPERDDEVVATCVKAAEAAQTERSAHHLRSARDLLLTCAQSTCPAVVRADCATWLSEVDLLMPSVVVVARDPRGTELYDVRVSVDGELAASRLDGLAIAVDPGTHRFLYEAPNAPPVEQQLVIREGEKGRVLWVTLVPPTPSPPPSVHRRRAPPITYILGGLGTAGVAGFAYFGVTGAVEAADLKQQCGETHSCTEDQVAPVRRELLVADVSLGIGLVSLGTALYFYLNPVPAPAPRAVQPTVALSPDMARVGVQGRF
jgi:hypothetical protein